MQALGWPPTGLSTYSQLQRSQATANCVSTACLPHCLTAPQALSGAKQGSTSSSRQQALLLHHKTQLGTSLVGRREAAFPEGPLRQAAGRSTWARAKPGVFYNK